MSKVFNVAVVGCGIGRSHIVEGYLPNAGKFKVQVLCDLNAERMNAVGDEFGIAVSVRSLTSLRNCRPNGRWTLLQSTWRGPSLLTMNR